ncbi:MAG: glutamine--tRNA ligase, partial [Candidatus Limiplasma sp.]|nr:glutamine--tRNA ligase [Candidatus Limiplasma sp.]
DFLTRLNPASLEVCRGFMEASLGTAAVGDTFQFLRMGYFCMDPDSTAGLAVFNRVVGLKDSFKKEVRA